MPTRPKRSPSRYGSGSFASASSSSTGRTEAVAIMSEGKSWWSMFASALHSTSTARQIEAKERTSALTTAERKNFMAGSCRSVSKKQARRLDSARLFPHKRSQGQHDRHDCFPTGEELQGHGNDKLDPHCLDGPFIHCSRLRIRSVASGVHRDSDHPHSVRRDSDTRRKGAGDFPPHHFRAPSPNLHYLRAARIHRRSQRFAKRS